MNPPSDMKTDLTTEERALAQRLARLGPHGEPSPALDARVLAAAHDAVAHDATVQRARVHGPRRRWPAVFGIAASLAIAVGIAWQLRPLPQTTAAYETQAPAAPSLPADSDNAAIAKAAMESAAAPTDATVVAQQADAGATLPAPMPAARPQVAKARSPAPPASPAPAEPMPEPDIVFDSPTPAAEAAARSMSAAAAPQAFGSRPPPTAPTASEKRKGAAAAADAAAGALPETDTLDRLQATGTDSAAASDEPDTDVPPATMTSPEARDAWLARIRELVAAGKSDAARASLREFMHRYPDAPLPDDLRALGQ